MYIYRHMYTRSSVCLVLCWHAHLSVCTRRHIQYKRAFCMYAVYVHDTRTMVCLFMLYMTMFYNSFQVSDCIECVSFWFAATRVVYMYVCLCELILSTSMYVVCESVAWLWWNVFKMYTYIYRYRYRYKLHSRTQLIGFLCGSACDTHEYRMCTYVARFPRFYNWTDCNACTVYTPHNTYTHSFIHSVLVVAIAMGMSVFIHCCFLFQCLP